ncbi:MAG: enoyl-CoA hydratase/isomerase family protein, partial [Actinomycetota bacterium]
MLTEVIEAAERISESDARTVVVSGTGTSFSAGMDITTFSAGALVEADADIRYDAARLGGQAAAALENMPQIAIAALCGHVVGGGIVLAAACDLRIAEEDVTFSIPEVDIGIPLGWGGIERLVREIGPARTKELVLTCRPFSAEEAKHAGFVSSVVDTGEGVNAAVDLARTIASKSRFAVTTTKRHVAEILKGDLSRDDALGLVAAIEDPAWLAHRDAYMEQLD